MQPEYVEGTWYQTLYRRMLTAGLTDGPVSRQTYARVLQREPEEPVTSWLRIEVQRCERRLGLRDEDGEAIDDGWDDDDPDDDEQPGGRRWTRQRCGALLATAMGQINHSAYWQQLDGEDPRESEAETEDDDEEEELLAQIYLMQLEETERRRAERAAEQVRWQARQAAG